MISFHHVGVITSDLVSTTQFYEQIGYKEFLTIEDDTQIAKIVLLQADQGPMVELIYPLSSESPAYSWIKRIGAGPYHTCYECDDLEKQLEAFCSQGLMQISEIVTAIAFNNRRIVFLWGKQSGLIELLSKK
jgi:methylmalonyl-CoA/ethylmalonyl-CoA epimerase